VSSREEKTSSIFHWTHSAAFPSRCSSLFPSPELASSILNKIQRDEAPSGHTVGDLKQLALLTTEFIKTFDRSSKRSEELDRAGKTSFNSSFDSFSPVKFLISFNPTCVSGVEIWNQSILLRQSAGICSSVVAFGQYSRSPLTQQ